MPDSQSVETYPPFPTGQIHSSHHPRELPHDILEEKIVLPLTDSMTPVQTEVDTIFPPVILDGLASQVTPKDINIILNLGLRYDQQKTFHLTNEEVRHLVMRDIQERATDHVILHQVYRGKAQVAELILGAAKEELQIKTADRKMSDVDNVILHTLVGDVADHLTRLQDLADQSLHLGPNLLADLRITRELKQRLIYESHHLASLSQVTERISPELFNLTNFHRGLMQGFLKKTAELVSDRRPGVYVREHAGTWAHLLGINLMREFRLPEKSHSASCEIEVYSSGMGTLGSVMDSVNKTWSSPQTFVTSGFYFELPDIAKKDHIIFDTVPVNDFLYLNLARQLKAQTSKPIVIYAQPFSSSMDDEVIDIHRILDVISTTDTDRPIALILDSTMHGPSLNLWPQVTEITSSGKNFTLIEMQSLVKHGQIGMDTVPGGFAIGYGSHPELIRGTTGSRGTMMPEHSAAVLFPFFAEHQMHRIQRAGRNAHYLAQYLSSMLEDNPLFENVYYPPETSTNSRDLVSEYGSKPPFFFLKIHPLVPDQVVARLNKSLEGQHRNFPESGIGTSYGFDGTRTEPIPLGRDGSSSIRIAAGQESTLLLMSIANYLERYFNNPEHLENTRSALNFEILQVTNPIYQKDDIRDQIYFNPIANPHDYGDQYIESLHQGPIIQYLHDQCRGRQISNEFKKDPRMQQLLQIPDDTLSNLEDHLEPVLEIRKLMTSWIITQPEFIDHLREKLTFLGKSPSRDTAYHIAQIVTDKKAVQIALAPIAKTINQILKEIQPDIESQIGAHLPFNF